ncbi:MAG: Ig-like domain-containing protein [Oscillospiraceae bacterium]|nr:Ig-like domain-containing protein [Oscillospiraceae bacterium]
MKKSIFCLLALLLLLPLFAPAALAAEDAAEDGFTEIRDAEGLRAIADAPEGDYRLAADLDLSGIDWKPIAFSGRLDGAGHTLYNLRVTGVGDERRVTKDGNLKEYDTVFAGLFSTLENAEVYDLTLTAPFLEIEGREHCFVGILAGYADRSSITRVTVVGGRASLVNFAVMTGVSGLVGYGCGEISECSVECELFFEDRNFDFKCEEFLAGILGCGIANIQHCTVSIQGYDSCHGYVHNGGLVGMFYHCDIDYKAENVFSNRTEGHITFFEDNRDRRAYCAPWIGESLTKPRNYAYNTNDFQRIEVKDFTRVLRPEKCEEPSYAETVTPPDCENWGYTDHVCETCGYAWRDSYTPPQHEPGEWEILREPDGENDGLRRRTCVLCGALTDEEIIPHEPEPTPEPEIAAEPEPEKGFTLPGLERRETDAQRGGSITMTYRSKARAKLPEGVNGTPVWSTDDPSVAVVDEDGTVTAVGQGSTVLRCESADGSYRSELTVTVEYSVWQWLIILFLFGWLWYI